MANERCAHPDCNCDIEPGKGVSKDGEMYCGEFCASGEGANPEDCQCGHSNCA